MWLSGWAKRIKVTVSNTNIDSDLTHFPLLLTLGASVGTGSDDTTCVFDELTSDNNRKKIAVTKDDGTTQCYVEIEKWDDANEKAVLWVSKSDLVLSSTGTTDLYLYYDSSHADNTTYVGDIGDRTEVWDSNFKGVWHLAEDPSGTAPQETDSTSNNNDGTSGGSMTSGDLVAAKIGDGLDFDGSDDRIMKTSPTGGNTQNFTVEAWVKADTSTQNRCVFNHVIDNGSTSYVMYVLDNDYFYGQIGGSGYTTNLSISLATYYYLAFSYDGTTMRFRANGNTDSHALTTTVPDGDSFVIGNNYRVSPPTSNSEFDGIIDEVRISNIARSAAWIKATYYAQSDNLVSWGSEEEAPTTFIPQIIMF